MRGGIVGGMKWTSLVLKRVLLSLAELIMSKSQQKIIWFFNFLKAVRLLISISRLSGEAIGEAIQDLEEIKKFYGDYSPVDSHSNTTTKIIEGRIVSVKTREPLELD